MSNSRSKDRHFVPLLLVPHNRRDAPVYRPGFHAGSVVCFDFGG